MVIHRQVRLRERVIQLMEKKGPQSINDLCFKLGISNGSSRSILVRLQEAGKIERIERGVYRKKRGDKSNNPDKPNKV